ncbi:MAG TPA: hypothetical protein VGG44_03320 [Tepidisphaeraceae bacterium]|jgi:hypothetical protein
MLSSRDICLLNSNPAISLSDQELRIAIAREVIGWKNVRQHSDGRITAETETVLTTVPLSVPDWINDESRMSYLELGIKRKGWFTAYQRELAKIAGDFNPNPSARQRCEAALSTARLSPMDRY